MTAPDPLPPQLLEDIAELRSRGLRPGAIAHRVGLPLSVVVRVLFPPESKDGGG